MKKLFLLLFFGAGIVSTSALTPPMFNCHTYACQVVAQYENYNPNASAAEIEVIYDMAYENCNHQ